MEVYCGSGSGWDAHNDLEGNHNKWCKVSDKPIAGLLTDLKARGLLEETLVVWGGEFGRTPFNEKGIGRDHNPWGFTTWMAGGGINDHASIGTQPSRCDLLPQWTLRACHCEWWQVDSGGYIMRPSSRRIQLTPATHGK